MEATNISHDTSNIRFSNLTSAGFLVGLFILLLNDHFLKTNFPGYLTGKLSDFAGLFIFPIFLSVLFPKHIRLCYGLTAIGFIYWKLPWSATLLSLFNQHSFLTLHKIPDYDDLLALSILPLSYLYAKAPKNPLFPQFYSIPFSIAIVAFLATSKAPEQIQINNTYTLQIPVDSVKSRLLELDSITIKCYHEPAKPAWRDTITSNHQTLISCLTDTIQIGFNYNAFEQFETFNFYIVLKPLHNGTGITINDVPYKMHYEVENPPKQQDIKQLIIRKFEEDVIFLLQ